MRWFERAPILDYIITAYAGTEQNGGAVKRQFIWEEANGDLVIGNTRAFADHLARRFNLPLSKTSWMSVHEALRMLGEIAQEHSARTRKPGRKFKNQLPEVRVIKKRQ